MKMKLLCSLGLAAALLCCSSAFAGKVRTYQVTGPILEMNDTMIAVQKGSERWEVARDASTEAKGALKVGDKVTITYTMTATEIEAKGAMKKATMAPKTTSTAAPSPVKK